MLSLRGDAADTILQLIGEFFKCPHPLFLDPGSDHGPTIKHVTLLLHIPSHDLDALQLGYDHVLFLLHMLICSTGARLALTLATVPVSWLSSVML